MKTFVLCALSALAMTHAAAAAENDSATPEATVAAFLKAISGEAGVKRSLDEINQYLDEDALTLNAIARDGKVRPNVQSTAEWLEKGMPFWEESGYTEKCLGFESSAYNNIAQVMCPYEFVFGDNAPVQGVVSIQLFHNGSEWKILSYLFTHEGPEETINDRFDL